MAVILVSCSGDSPTAPRPPTPGCTFQLAASSTSIGPEGATATVSVTAAAGCAWTAQSSASWITVASGASGSGDGTVSLAIASNGATAERQGTVTIAQQTVTFTQRGRDLTCTYAVTPDSQTYGPEGGTGRVVITAPDGCRWTASTTDTWLTLQTTEGVGSGQVPYSLAPWTGTTQRSTTIRVADRTTTIRQDGDTSRCTYRVNPTEFTLHWHGPGGTVAMETLDGCPWTTSAGDAWLEVERSTRYGSGTLPFTVGQHLSHLTRRAAIEVRWPAASAGQNVWVNQEGCWYAISEHTKAVTRDGGSAMLGVFGTPVSQSCSIGCPWTIASDVSWIQIAGSGTRAGDDYVTYTVAPNPGPGSRTGRITAAGYTLVITQTF